MYGRVQEHDPTNTRASAAIAGLTAPVRPHATMAIPAPPAARPAPAPPPPSELPPKSAGGSFVDLGSMIFEETAAPRDTRMRIDRREPQDEDEQREFKEMLEQFKRGIEENLGDRRLTRPTTISASRSRRWACSTRRSPSSRKRCARPDGRLAHVGGSSAWRSSKRASSPSAEAVLRRAVDALRRAATTTKIGLLYWLGRALEAQSAAARRCRELRAGDGGGHPVHGPAASASTVSARGGRDDLSARAGHARRPAGGRRSTACERVPGRAAPHRRGGFRPHRPGELASVPDAGQDVPPDLAAAGRRGAPAAAIPGRSPWRRWSS